MWEEDEQNKSDGIAGVTYNLKKKNKIQEYSSAVSLQTIIATMGKGQHGLHHSLQNRQCMLIAIE
jgi:hypothetical protein